MADKRALLLLLLAVATTQGQTRIDLASQSRNANFANFLFTTPFTMGPTLPPTCQVGQVFFNTAVPAGQNIYACAQTNAWTAWGAGNFTTEVTSPFYYASILGAPSLLLNGGADYGQLQQVDDNDWCLGYGPTLAANGTCLLNWGASAASNPNALTFGGPAVLHGYTFATLPASPVAGEAVYCSDCTLTTPTAASGPGGLVVRVGTTWSGVGGGGGTPGGTKGQVQYNNSGAFGGLAFSGIPKLTAGVASAAVANTDYAPINAPVFTGAATLGTEGISGFYYASNTSLPVFVLNGSTNYGQVQGLSGNSWGLGYGGSAAANGTTLMQWADSTATQPNLVSVPQGKFQIAAVSANPGCTTVADLGKQWFDNTTTTTAYKTCMDVAGTVGWAASGGVGGSGITQLTGDGTAGPGVGSQAFTLANTAVTPGSYTSTNLTVDAKGRITAASNGSGGGGTPGGTKGQVQYNNSGAFGGLAFSGIPKLTAGVASAAVANTDYAPINAPVFTGAATLGTEGISGFYYASNTSLPVFVLNGSTNYGQVQGLSGNSWGLGYGGSAAANGTTLMQWADSTATQPNLVSVPQGKFQIAAVSANPGCTTVADLGKQWFDNTTTTTAYKTCMDVAGTVGWAAPGGAGNMGVTSGAGAPSGSCTAFVAWYVDTTNQDDWFCSATNTWKKNLSTLNSGPFLGTGQTSSSVPAAPQSGNAALFFNSSSIAQTENSSGSVSGTEIAPASSATANQFVTYIDNTGTVHTAQPASTNLSDVANLATNAQSFTAGAFQYDFSGASHTLPSKTGLGASKPATCTVGEEYFATDATAGQNKYYCTATNTWTQQTGGGGSGSGVGTIFNTGYLANTDIGTSWVGLNPGGSQSAEGVMVSVMPVAGVFANMCVSNYIALDASGSIVIELYGGSALTGKTATGITVTIPASAAAGTIACDTTHTFTATAANEFFEYRVTDNNTGGNRYLNSISMQYR